MLDAGPPEPPRAKGPRFAAWTDSAAVAALTTSCHVLPPERPREQSYDRDPLACSMPWEQSCSYDPCFEKVQRCRGECGKMCGTCDDACTSTCDDCNAHCKDDACRATCAQTTGACKQACLTTVDHCAYADCSKEAKACVVDEKRKWLAHGCSCKKIEPCTSKCLGGMTTCGANCPDDYFKTCTDKCSKKFGGCDVMYCIMGSDPAISN